jgi:UDP-N-acetylmuramoyl-L-alanyl-D-glutamate--2,6-diaminopimelate ligase
MSNSSPKSLADLLQSVPGVSLPSDAALPWVQRIVADARKVQPGDLFVALRGQRTDGHLYTGEAVSRGAVAVVAERDPGLETSTPVIRVANTHRALAELAAAWFEHPARRLWLIGITGSFGKTGTLNMLRMILHHAGLLAGAIGSDFIGARIPGGLSEPALLTTPDPLKLHETLALIAENSGQICIMEVTSHGLVQERVHGLEFALGIFTCIAPLEHSRDHGSFRKYVEAKSRFFGHIVPGAPIVYPTNEPVVRRLIEGLDLMKVSCGARPDASVRIRRRSLEPGRTRMILEVTRPLPVVRGGTVEPVAIPVELRLLGRTNARNAALAAAAALCLGASPDAVREGLAAVQAPPRRLRLENRGRFQLLDDTATHPDSLGVLFEVGASIRHRRLHLVAAIRGARGPDLNRHYGQSLAIWARKHPGHSLIVTSSLEAVGEIDRVGFAEREAFLGELRRAGVAYLHRERLDEAIRLALKGVDAGDLLVLIGAQGMHAGANVVRRSTPDPP